MSGFQPEDAGPTPATRSRDLFRFAKLSNVHKTTQHPVESFCTRIEELRNLCARMREVSEPFTYSRSKTILLSSRVLAIIRSPVYYVSMTWDYNKEAYEKQADADPVWHLERLINYGLNGEKLNRELLKKHLSELKIPQNRRDFLELLLWDKKF